MNYLDETKYTQKEWEELQDKERAETIGEISQITIKAVAGIIIFSVLLWSESRFFNWIDLDIDSLAISYKPLLFSSEVIPIGFIAIIAIDIYIAKKVINKIFSKK